MLLYFKTNIRLFKSFLNHIRREKFFDNKDRILAAVSGGVDSMVLLELLQQSGIQFRVAHFDHMTRNGQSTKDAEFVLHQCQQRGIECEIGQMNTEWKLNNFQAEGRRQRYDFFNSLNYDCLVLAHHSDDIEENIVMNFIQGKSLNPIPKVNKDIVRPLAAFSKSDIMAFAESMGVLYCYDSSNDDTSYLRNFVRHKVLAVLDQKIPDHKTRIIQLSDRLNKESVLLNELIEDRLSIDITNEVIRISHDSIRDFGTNALTAVHKYLLSFGFSQTQTQNLLDSLDRSGIRFNSQTHSLLNDRHEILIRKLDQEEIQLNQEIDITELPQTIDLGKSALLIEKSSASEITDDQNVLICPKECLSEILILRNWQESDHFHPLGMEGQKQSLKKFFSNNKINRFQKKQIPILCDMDGNIIWIMGMRSDERYKVTDPEQACIRFTLKN